MGGEFGCLGLEAGSDRYSIRVLDNALGLGAGWAGDRLMP